MAKRTLRRVLAGGALIAAFTLTTPTPAHAGGLTAESLWGWLAGFWAGPSVPTTHAAGSSHPQGHARGVGRWEKAGGCIDPNGCASSQATGTSPCAAHGDIGPCVDPNG